MHNYNAFSIYIEQLRQGHIEKIKENLPPDFLEVPDKELSFPEDVLLDGEVYVANDTLVMHFNVQTTVTLQCVICQGPVNVDIRIKGLYQTVPVTEIPSGIYNFKEALREIILLEVPKFAECNAGNCPERQGIAKYLKQPHPGVEDDEGTYRPFADL
jgi:uncharacterized metal-binding protein YceD (DUF177 family)